MACLLLLASNLLLPSIVYTSKLTRFWGMLFCCRQAPVSTSQMRTVLSREPLQRRVLSGKEHTIKTVMYCYWFTGLLKSKRDSANSKGCNHRRLQLWYIPKHFLSLALSVCPSLSLSHTHTYTQRKNDKWSAKNTEDTNILQQMHSNFQWH